MRRGASRSSASTCRTETCSRWRWQPPCRSPCRRWSRKEWQVVNDELTVVECINEHLHGDYDKAIILVNGNRLRPERSQAVRNHSPGGFSWGYLGSGPAQLALAILLECNVDEEDAQRVYQDFKEQFIG